MTHTATAAVLVGLLACGADDPGTDTTSGPTGTGPGPNPNAWQTVCDAEPGPVGTCQTHWDCDGDPANGCETARGTVDDCGGCGIACDPGEICLDGMVCAAEDPFATGDLADYPEAVQLAAGHRSLCVRHGSGTVQCTSLDLGSHDVLMEPLPWAETSGGMPCLRHADGTAWCWWGDLQGAWVGDAGGTLVDDLTGVGEFCGVRADGSVVCRGPDVGTVGDVAVFEAVPDLSGVVAVQGADDSGDLFLRADGTVHYRPTVPGTPFDLPCVEDAVDIGVGAATQCVVRAEGTVACAYDRWRNKLPTGVDERTPVLLPGITDAIDVEVVSYKPPGSDVAYFDGAAVRTASGAVFLVTPMDQHLELTALHGAVSVGADSERLCGVLPDGSVSCVEANDDQPALPLGMTDPCADDPASCAEFGPMVDGISETWCDVLANGAVLCWGNGTWGRLGEGDGAAIPEGPVHIELPAPAVDVKVGRYHVCALTSTAEAWCWGNNTDGQLGPDAIGRRQVPALWMDDVLDLSLGVRGTCAVRSDNTVWCAGQDVVPGVSGDEPTPMPVPGVTGAVEIEAGATDWAQGLFARLDDGSVVAWRTWTMDPSDPPAPWCGVGGVEQMVSGDGVVCLRTGTDWSCAGWSEYGVLGPNQTTSCPTDWNAGDGATTLWPRQTKICGVLPDGTGTCAGPVGGGLPSLGPVLGLIAEESSSNVDGCALEVGRRAPTCWDGDLLPPRPFRYLGD